MFNTYFLTSVKLNLSQYSRIESIFIFGPLFTINVPNLNYCSVSREIQLGQSDTEWMENAPFCSYLYEALKVTKKIINY